MTLKTTDLSPSQGSDRGYTDMRGDSQARIGSEKEQRWRNKPTIQTKRPSNLFPQQEIFREDTTPQGTSADPLTDRQRREQAVNPSTTQPKIPQDMETEQRCGPNPVTSSTPST
ncbi:hypothetical protein LAZ67_2003168 [Cordylochernes scorpioides]|uniref:Uncharacterized protein n=1 Tax=Cordylochernes scorpioides TaxID=51811 RepID=A0ABY6K3C7_9ARAC|nr:hypothetical protein LAZ67_2003168 [Cordylochernes scorpioides]